MSDMNAPTVILLLMLLLAGLTSAMVFGARRWGLRTREMRAQLRAALEPTRPQQVDLTAIGTLPAPVQRYLETVLTDGQTMLAEARLYHRGKFNMGKKADKWKGFTSDQLSVTKRPGFDWHGRIGPVRVHDAYIEGEGILRAALYGVLTLVNLSDSHDLARGELMRFLAEAVWYPTLLLPGQGVRWKAVDDRSARATIADGPHEVSLLFTFGDGGLVETVSADTRGRMVRGKFEPTPWQGRFWNYQDRAGIKVPLDGEVAWVMPEGPRPYWLGHLTNIEYVTETQT